MSSDSNEKAVLKGKTLQVYRFIIRRNGPVRVREIQRSLGFSSPSLVLYHLEKAKGGRLDKRGGHGLYSRQNYVKKPNKIQRSIDTSILLLFLVFYFRNDIGTYTIKTSDSYERISNCCNLHFPGGNRFRLRNILSLTRYLMLLIQ